VVLWITFVTALKLVSLLSRHLVSGTVIKQEESVFILREALKLLNRTHCAGRITFHKCLDMMAT
jgi:hypothetical protein